MALLKRYEGRIRSAGNNGKESVDYTVSLHLLKYITGSSGASAVSCRVTALL